jgi:hypothetical protein
MCYAGLISQRLYNILYRYFDYDVKLEDLKEIEIDKFHLMYGVGERTVNEFKKLMKHETN